MNDIASFRPFAVAGLALVIATIGDACTRQDDSTGAEEIDTAVEAAVQAPADVVAALDLDAPVATVPDAGPPTTAAPTTAAPTTAAPTTAAPTTAAPTTAAPTTGAPTTAAPAPESGPEPEPEPIVSWDGACGPNDAVPGDASAVTSTTLDLTGEGAEGTASTYLTGGEWILRFDGPLVQDEMVLPFTTEQQVRVVTGVDIHGFGANEILVATDTNGPITEFGLFGNHDGCLFQHHIAPDEPLTLQVGVTDDVMYGVACHTDEWGSFITSRSAVSNGDGTWNVYGTSYTAGDAPFQIDAGDGGHSFGLPGDHMMFSTFANVECGDVELGEF